MKKIFSVLVVCLIAIFAASLTACDGKNGTYYPSSEEMSANLKNSGYEVTLSDDLGDKSGTYLSATKGDDYIHFYWLDNAADCEYFYDYLETNCKDYNSLVQVSNDKKFGNLIYCGTKAAVDDAGITVVKVKV